MAVEYNTGQKGIEKGDGRSLEIQTGQASGRGGETARASTSSEDDRKCVDVAGAALPSEIIERILSLLPPACIFKFRSVCKKWNATLSSQPFLKTCIQELFGLSMLFTFTEEWCRSAAGYSHKSNKWYKFPFNFVPHLEGVQTSAGGLVLCKNLVGRDDGFVDDGYVVCNPATKGWVQLPQPSSPSEPSMMAMKLVHSSDSAAGAFQVIRSVHHMSDSISGQFSLLEAYSSDTKIWTEVGKVRHCTLTSLLWCNDSLYCLSNSRPHVLVSMPMSGRLDHCQWRSFDLPPVRDLPKLLEWNGNVILPGISSTTNELRIWTLNSVTFEWTTIGKGMNPYVMGTDSEHTRFSSVACGDFIIFIGELVGIGNMNLLAFDIPRKRWKFVENCPFFKRTETPSTPCYWSCDPSLVSPF